jgi:hypothetical protein
VIFCLNELAFNNLVFVSFFLHVIHANHCIFRSDDDLESSSDNEVAAEALVTCPFNLNDISVVQEVDSDDAIPQEAIFDGLFLQQDRAPVDGPIWEQTPVATLNLSSLERMYRLNDRSSAIKLLHCCVNLVLDSDLKLHNDDPKLLWKGSKHFLDFILVVSGNIGLPSPQRLSLTITSS